MPWVKVGDISLYYEVHGQGEPLLFIQGLGYATWTWFKQREYFARNYKVILFDNRGTGDSDKPDHPYTIEMMARDTAGLLEALQIKEVQVIGISMGGIIAQELTLLFPDLVKKVVLGCTSFGGPNSVPMPPETINVLMGLEDLEPAEKLRVAMSTAFPPSYMEANLEEIDRIIKWRLAKPTPPYAWWHQFKAVAAFNAEDRVSAIRVPTFILSGDQDKVLPVENAYLLHEKISQSHLKIFLGAGHLFFIEQAARFNKEVADFLAGGNK